MSSAESSTSSPTASVYSAPVTATAPITTTYIQYAIDPKTNSQVPHNIDASNTYLEIIPFTQVQVEYLATAEGLQDAANAAAVEYIGLEQGAAAALIDESGNLIHSARYICWTLPSKYSQS